MGRCLNKFSVWEGEKWGSAGRKSCQNRLFRQVTDNTSLKAEGVGDWDSDPRAAQSQGHFSRMLHSRASSAILALFNTGTTARQDEQYTRKAPP